MQPSTTTRNLPQPSTTIHNYPQPSKTIHSHLQRSTTIHNYPQPSATIHNHPQPSKTTQKLPQKPKLNSCYYTLDVNTERDVDFDIDMKHWYIYVSMCLSAYTLQAIIFTKFWLGWLFVFVSIKS